VTRTANGDEEDLHRVEDLHHMEDLHHVEDIHHMDFSFSKSNIIYSRWFAQAVEEMTIKEVQAHSALIIY
jgi:hypothetical protein